MDKPFREITVAVLFSADGLRVFTPEQVKPTFDLHRVKLVGFAEVLIPFEADGEQYCITAYVLNKLNHEPAVLEMLAIQSHAADIVRDFGAGEQPAPQTYGGH